jgi:hypothetical protein
MSIEVPSVALGSARRVVRPDYRTAPEWPKAGWPRLNPGPRCACLLTNTQLALNALADGGAIGPTSRPGDGGEA